jgi:membrane protein YqaA with SNARE-associated domain
VGSGPLTRTSLATEGQDAPAGHWLGRAARHPGGEWVLAVLAILEASVFPAPTEAAFLALALARPRGRRPPWRLVAIATAGSLVGALVAYGIGAEYFDRLGRPLLERLGIVGEFEAVAALYRDNTLLALLTSGYTPIPYVLYTITAGASAIPLATFVVGSLLGRGIKYAVLGLVTFHAGPAVQAAFRRASGWVMAVIVAAAAAWWWLGR